MKKILKKHQIIIYIIAVVMMTVGYLNYKNIININSVEASMEMEAKDDSKLADLGDATLVSSNDVVSEESENNTNNSDKNLTVQNENIENNAIETSTTQNPSDEYFAKSKLERDSMYSQIIETYEKVLNSSNSLETQKQTATQEITKVNENKNKIMICENLIKTKGFDNNIIFINGDSISVIIGTEEIKPDEISQIQNIISREMNAKIENIHISTK